MPSGTPINRSNITLPADVASGVIAKTQENSAIMQLAQQIALPGRGTSVHVITSDPQANWVDETAVKPITNPGLATKVMQPYKLAVVVPFSEEFMRDAKTLYDEIIKRLPGALAKEFDATVFTGTAPGSNFDVLSGCTAHNLSSDPYKGLVEADTAIAVAGGIADGYVLAPQGKGLLLGATDQNKRPLFINNAAEGAIPVILGSKTVISKGAYKSAAGGDTIGVVGDWTKAYYGTVEDVKMKFTDSATLKDSNNNPIYLWQQNMVAVLAEIEVGFVADTDCFQLLTQTHVGS